MFSNNNNNFVGLCVGLFAINFQGGHGKWGLKENMKKAWRREHKASVTRIIVAGIDRAPTIRAVDFLCRFAQPSYQRLRSARRKLQ